MNLCAFSQVDYPRKAVIDKDTVCIISIEQARTINNVFIDRDECNELKDSLSSQVKTYSALVSEQDKLIASQGKEIEIKENIIAEKNVIIESDSKLLKKQNRQVKWLKLQRNILAGFAMIVAGVITYQKISK